MTDTPMQEPNDLTPPEGQLPVDAGAPEASGDAKPKRTRKPKAVEEAVAEGEAVMARKSATRRRTKAADADPAPSADVDAPVPVVEAGEAEQPAQALKPKRAPRRKAAAEPVAADSDDTVPQASLSFESALGRVEPEAFEAAASSQEQAQSGDDAEADAVREAAGDGFLQLGPDEGVEAAAPAPRRERGERGERGDRGPRPERGPRVRREDGGAPRPDQAASGEAAPGNPEADADGDTTMGEDGQPRPSRRAVMAAEQAAAVFVELLSGDFDKVHEEEVELDDEEAVATKRVLRPEPDAPKLQKVLAQSGIGSRRDIEQMIEEGRISVNGEVAHIGQRVSYGDKIAVGGKPIRVRIQPPPARILAYHKPTGEVVTHEDPQQRPTVFRRLPRLQHGKWLSVGRLDLNTEGLLLFTNSGDLANQLMHPRFGVEREYAVRVLGTLSPESKAQLLAGVEIEGQAASFKSIEDGGGEGVNRWYKVVITEGRNREVRKLFDTVGLTVSRLIRVRYGSIVLPHGLKRGVWVELGESDVRAVKSLAGHEAQPRQGDRNDRGDRGDRTNDRGNRHNNQRGEPRQQDQRPQGNGQQGDGKFGKNRFGGNGQPQGQGPRGQNGPHGQNGGGRGPQQGGQGGQGGYGNNRQQGFNKPPRDDQRPAERRGDDDLDDIGPIPNPLEQTFDKRFAKGSKRITSGFGRPDHDHDRPGGGGPKGGPRQPDPLQTAVGYIGADAYFGKSGGGGHRGGGGGNRSGGGGGGGGGGRRGR